MADRVREQPLWRRRRSGPPRRRLGVGRRLWIGVDEGERQVDVGDPVAERVVHLEDQPHCVHRPARRRTTSPTADAPDRGVETAGVPSATSADRRRPGRGSEVSRTWVLEIEVVVGRPTPVAPAPYGTLHHPLAQPRDAVHPACDMGSQGPRSGPVPSRRATGCRRAPRANRRAGARGRSRSAGTWRRWRSVVVRSAAASPVGVVVEVSSSLAPPDRRRPGRLVPPSSPRHVWRLPRGIRVPRVRSWLE